MSLLGSAGEWFGLGLKLNRAKSAIEREGRMYDVRVTLLKGAKALGMGCVAVAGAAVAGYLSDSTVVTEVLRHGGVSDVIVIALVPLIKSLATMAGNYLKHADK